MCQAFSQVEIINLPSSQANVAALGLIKGVNGVVAGGSNGKRVMIITSGKEALS